LPFHSNYRQKKQFWGTFLSPDESIVPIVTGS
jgi:hypothetical protein